MLTLIKISGPSFQHYPHDLAQTIPTATLLCSCTHGPALEVGALPETEELRVRAWFTNKSWTGIKQNLHTQGRKTVPSITGSLNHQPGFTTHQAKPKRKTATKILLPFICLLHFEPADTLGLRLEVFLCAIKANKDLVF